MARQEVNIGTTGNDATGDSIRTGFNKVNQNFIKKTLDYYLILWYNNSIEKGGKLWKTYQKC